MRTLCMNHTQANTFYMFKIYHGQNMGNINFVKNLAKVIHECIEPNSVNCKIK